MGKNGQIRLMVRKKEKGALSGALKIKPGKLLFTCRTT